MSLNKEGLNSHKLFEVTGVRLGFSALRVIMLFMRRFYLALLPAIRCVQKKRDQNVFCNISYKTRAMLTKFGTPFTE